MHSLTKAKSDLIMQMGGLPIYAKFWKRLFINGNVLNLK